MSRVSRLLTRRIALVGALLAVVVLLAVSTAPARAEGGGERPYDAGAVLVHPATSGDLAQELSIQYFSTGTPPVRWAASEVPIDLCTQQANRPAAISAQRFRDVVTNAANMWNAAEAAVGVRYDGDCVLQGPWIEGNRINEVAWDDQRNEVRSPAAGVTQGRWFEFVGRREFTEADIILADGLDVPDVCLQSIVSHEVGHALGFGHSDQRGDIMYPSFNGSDLSTCVTQASTAEIALLRGLYGTNRAPVIAPVPAQTATAGALSQLNISASDPEGDPLTYRWTQTGGPTTRLTARGSSVSFVAPNLPGATVTLRVDVFDTYLHQTSATLTVALGGVQSAPTAPPSLESYRPGAAGARSVLRWTPVAGATFYRICTTGDSGVRSCADQPESSFGVAWNTILGPVAGNTAVRVLSTGTRTVAVAACNTLGCSDFAFPIRAGGVTWGSEDVNFDVIGMAIDYPAQRIGVTVGGVVNVSGAARQFSLYAGTLANPRQVLVQNCGSVAAGASCIGMMSPSAAARLPLVTIVSDRAGHPSVEYRVTIR